MKQRRAVGVRAAAIPEQQAHQRQSAKHADGGVPAVDALVQERGPAQQVGQADPLPAVAGKLAEYRATGVQLSHGQAAVGLDHIERRRLGPAIYRAAAGHEDATQAIHQAQCGLHIRYNGFNAAPGWPAGHFHREGNQYHYVAQHRRVERVLTQATI